MFGETGKNTISPPRTRRNNRLLKLEVIRLKFILSASVTLATLCFSSAETTAISPAPTPTLTHVKAGTYRVDAGHTQVAFSVLHFGFTYFVGLFAGASGTLQLDPAHLSTSKVEITIPVGSVTTTNSALDAELRGTQWFDAAKFPSATFFSTKVESTGTNDITITGNFTLHGVTKPIVLQARLIGAGVNPLEKVYTVGFDATAAIKRSDYGVSPYPEAVGDNVKLTIAGAFELR
jgi:polyisoprenoid-binding protein YceI